MGFPKVHTLLLKFWHQCYRVVQLHIVYDCKLLDLFVAMALLCQQDGLPMVVPEEFWIGERKLLWQAAHIEEIYECFPTIHLSMADHQNSSQQFTLAIVPQVNHAVELAASAFCRAVYSCVMISATPICEPAELFSLQLAFFLSTQLYLRQIDVQAGEADPAMCPPTSPCDAFTFGVKPRAQGLLSPGLRVCL